MTCYVVKKTTTRTGEETEVIVLPDMHPTKESAELLAMSRIGILFDRAIAGHEKVTKMVWDIGEDEHYITVIAGDETETTTRFDIVELSI